ncbi:MAG: ABC transporter permease [Gemmatimonadales bacterium]|jgi:predicted permease
MEQLRRDLSYAVRMLFRRPGLSLIIVITFALGIGLTFAVFSIVNGALYKGLPFEDADRLMVLGRTDASRNIQFMNVTEHDFVDWIEQQTTFEGLTAISIQNLNLAGNERRPVRYTGAFASANLFDVLGVQPALGRGFRPGEDRPGADPVIIIGYDVWQQRFDGAADVIGRTIRANGQARTIVGVAPEGFKFPDQEQAWVPLQLDPQAQPRGQGPAYLVVGRLKAATTLDEASAEMATIAQRLEQEYPESNEGIGATVRTFNSLILGGQVGALLHTMLGAALGVLLVACANVANLLLARASTRSREVAVRSALGAKRGRVIAQFMTEVVVLSIVGGAVGLVLGHFGLAWFNAVTNVEPPPFWITFGPDHRVAAFVIAAVAFSALFSGLVPALRATGGNVSESLKDEARGSSSFRLGKFSAGLVVAEVTLSCGLLIVAGLMIKSVAKLKTRDLPFTVENIFTARLRLPADEYSDTAARVGFYEELLPRLTAIPGVHAATLSDGLPATGNGTRVFEVEGMSYATDEDYPIAREGIVTPGYFETFQTPILQGRAFSVMDHRESPSVAVVNETFVRTFFPEGDALGRRVRMGRRDTTAQWLSVVGVVPDMLMEGMANTDASPAGFYIPISQSGVGTFVSIAVRTRGRPMTVTQDVRSAVEGMNADLPIYEVLSMEDAIAKETWFYWVFGSLFMVFGIMALFLAAVGLYGVMSFAVSRRTQEMGIRMALGADSPNLIRLVMRRGTIQLVIGIVLGVGLAAVAANPLQFILYEVDVRDPAVFGTVIAVLAAAGLLASLVPARRVTKVDPVAALTAE